jgi:hypothetical protein
MLEFADAALKFNIALSSFGAQRVLGVLPIANSEPMRAVQENFYKAGENAKQGFQTNTALFGAFQFSDKAQSALAGFASDALSLKAFKPAYIKHVASGIAQGSAAAMESLGSKKSRALLKQQFENTFDVISYVNHVDAPNQLSADGTYPLEEMIAQCYSHGDYPALWYVEGLGERYAEAYMAAGGNEIHDLLTSGAAAAADPKIQTMMHAGLGITLAKHAVANLTPWSTHAEFKAALKGFIAQVHQNSIPGYEGAALESLGLVTRTWNGQLVKPVSSHLLAMDPDAFEFFWHGAGRAMYFSPMYMLPGFSPWEAADSEPPNEIARHNARAGVAWAFTIVNVRQPGIASNFLVHKADRISGNDAYTDGVYSTLTMAGDMVPGHQYVDAFGVYQPKDPATLAAWNKYIGSNAGGTIDSYRAKLKASNKLGEVFRYHNLAEYVGGL